jgi:diguanylate cyclase (GGDEF)-like protein/putative nucleotidyltransferase with HDIG domain
MNIYFAVILAAFTLYIVLFAKVIWGGGLKPRFFLLVYLIASASWAITGYIAHANFYPEQTSLLGTMLPLMGLWAAVAYCQLICAFVGKKVATWTAASYTFVAALVILAALGHMPQSSQYVSNTGANIVLGPWQYTLIAGMALFALLPVFYLWLRYRDLRNLHGRNQVLYMMIGASAAAAVSTKIAIPYLPNYPLEHVGYAANALLVTYALSAQRQPDIKSAAKTASVYLASSLLVAPLYVLALWSLYHFSISWSSPAIIAIAIGLIFILPWSLIVLRKPVGKFIDKVLYGDDLHHRDIMLGFPKRMRNVLSLKQLAEGMLQPIPRALRATHASLLFPSNGEFISQFSNQIGSGDSAGAIELRTDSPIVSWLAENDEPLFREALYDMPEFEGVCEAERGAIEAMRIGLLVPMNSNGRLVGILALGDKMSRGLYSSDDILLLTTVASELAAPIGNAQLYNQIKERVHTDELTGLLNHGYFHQRVDEEISRCSRFGSIFSLLFLDIDLFKSYNDAFGHLAGDEVLRQVAQCIKGSIRGIDMPFRYGGDEFAILLPESSVDDATHVAERIRRNIETEMDSRGVALSCSIGIAAWPTDGVTRERVLQAADSALYLSKKAGRNRISLASERDTSQSLDNEIGGEQEVLSAVHALAATVDAKDSNTYGHSKKTSEYATYLAEALGYTSDKITVIRAAALLHDIGKIRVPDRLLQKAGPLNDEEWLAVREHPKFGVAILKHIKGLDACLPIIQHHHEHFDGQGYPAGLTAEHIPLDARILAVSDAYDAMTSPRPYRRDRMTHQEAIDELARYAGTQFDPEVVEVFSTMWEPLDSHVTTTGVSRVTKRRITSRNGKLVLLPYASDAR